MSLEVIGGRVIVGLVVGVLVGLTGVGGGMLLLPLLMSALGVPPIIAVGSDAVINCVTKVGAGSLHWHQGNVNWPLAFNLAVGSIPGAIVGITLLTSVRAVYGNAINDVLRVVIGILLIVIPSAYLLKDYLSQSVMKPDIGQARRFVFGIAFIGFVAGMLVGITSIGSGSVILMLLMVFYGFRPALMVGTDIVHAVFLAGVTGSLHFRLGNVDLPLVACVVIGSIPGALLGTYLTNYLSPSRFKQILCTILVAVGTRMIWGVVLHTS